ncbi:MAG: T9SS type A sorting domain-containing protein [Polaribacter sp.]
MKLLQTLIFIFLYKFTFSQNVNIPDANFKNYLLSNVAVNTNNDSEIQVSEAMNFTGTLSFQFRSINDLTGIEFFKNLSVLDCGDNNLTSINLAENTALEQLLCYDNNLTSLDLSNNTNLKVLDCRDNQLTTLDISNNTLLNYLSCPFNNIVSLNLENTILETLRCYSNNISSIDVSSLTTLSTILISNNNLTELDLSNNFALTVIECKSNNLLTDLNVANTNNTNVTTFDTRFNPELRCIQVDDATYSTDNWTSIDNGVVFSENCILNIESYDLIIKHYPNPTYKYLHIETLEKIDFNITTINGRVIVSGKLLEGKNKINVERLSKGIYLMKGKNTKGNIISFKFLKR